MPASPPITEQGEVLPVGGPQPFAKAEPPPEAPAVPPASRLQAAPSKKAKRSGIGTALGWLALALVVIALGTAIGMREQVMSSFPQSRAAYQFLGFHVPSATEGLLIENVRPTWSRNPGDNQPMLVIEGRVKNESDGPRDLPALRGVLRDGTREVHSWVFAAGPARIAAGETINFRTEVRPPSGAATVAIVFAVSE